MSEELDRRIAVEVMGEEEPPAINFEVEEEDEVDLWPTLSGGGNWWCHPRRRWTPRAFSTSLDLAMKAVDKYRADRKRVEPEYEGAIYMEYLPGPNPDFEADTDEAHGRGHTLPEAICNLLLALVEKK